MFVYSEDSGAYPSRRAIRVMGQHTGLHNAAPATPKHIHQDHIYCCVDLSYIYCIDQVAISSELLILSLTLVSRSKSQRVEEDGIVAVIHKQVGTSKNVIMAHLKTKCRLSSKKICESNMKT